MKLLFTDHDGTRYFINERGDIVDERGNLVSLTAEDNIRALLHLQ